ncbi:MAG TPA: DUF6622 family protein [Ramlibacter sp.]|nr:DUF6622 family protein [Ramlibacter sp.]
MSLTPILAVHVTAAIGAVVTGPVALWARRGRQQRPRLHRAFGHAWVTLMIATAVSALFIRGGKLPNIAGFSPIHLLVPVVLGMLTLSFWFLAKGNIAGHKKTMQRLYIGACLVAGAFTLLPGRLLGELLWVDWLGLVAPHVHPADTVVQPIATQGASMTPTFLQIVSFTPLWVWGLLAALLVLGLSQTRDRSASLKRIVIMPVAMTAFSLWGTISAFGATAAVLGIWSVAAAVLLLAVMLCFGPAQAAYDAKTRLFQLPGSWVPMALIAGIFVTKYAAGVAMAMRPELKFDLTFALALATVYGAFSGMFAGRAARLLRLALRPNQGVVPALQT